jgi:ornithine carbamoyltransferase
MPEVEEVARKNAAASGGSYRRTGSMAEAFADADIVYPKSWAPFQAMEKRTALYADNDLEGIKFLEKELLAQNAEFKEWECSEALMKLTRKQQALYLHCLPADISGVSCRQGEVAATVFDRYRDSLYVQASHKPYVIAAMIFLARFARPVESLSRLLQRATARICCGT